MLKIKNILIIIGIIIGLWFGINIGRDEPLLSNPFSHKPLQKKLLESGEDLLDKGNQAIKEKLRD